MTMFVGLVRDPGREPPDDPDRPPRRHVPHVSWRPFAWLAVVCWLIYAAGAVEGLASYALTVTALFVAGWRLDRWLSRQYWGGLTEFKS
jgi:hypothetical protein